MALPAFTTTADRHVQGFDPGHYTGSWQENIRKIRTPLSGPSLKDHMKFTPAKLPGVWIIEPERFADERGYFARTWCAEEFAVHDLNPTLVQCSTSFNLKRGTLRGLHYQVAQHGQDKLVRCTRGTIFDVAVDLRPDSHTYRQWVAVELTDANGLGLYIPKGVAHGFQTLADNSEVFYQMSQPYHPAAGRGLRWNSAWCEVNWPVDQPIMSDNDRQSPLEPQLT